MSAPRAAAVAVAIALLATGCGDDGGSQATAPTTAVVPSTTSIANEPSTVTSPTTTTSAGTATTAVAQPTVVDDVLQGASDTDRYTYEVTFPRLVGGPDANVQDAFNAQIRSEITSAIDEFVAAVKELGAPPPDQADQRSALDGEYDVARIDEDLASIRVRLSTYFLGAAHPGTGLRTYNFDLRTGKRLALGDLFTAGSPYLARLSELSRELLNAQPGFRDLPEFVQPGTEPTAENFAGWTLTDQDLVITFAEYQVAPYAMGMPHVSIPFASLRLLIDPVGPLAKFN